MHGFLDESLFGYKGILEQIGTAISLVWHCTFLGLKLVVRAGAERATWFVFVMPGIALFFVMTSQLAPLQGCKAANYFNYLWPTYVYDTFPFVSK